MRWSSTNHNLIAGDKLGNLAIWELEDHNQKLCKSGSFSQGWNEFGIERSGLRATKSITYSHKFMAHSSAVEDCVINPHNTNVVCSASEDGMVKFWDLRNVSGSKSSSQTIQTANVSAISHYRLRLLLKRNYIL